MEYYLISDLHIGGDAYLDECEFEEDLISFLKEIEDKDEGTELIILGDFLGMWELTEVIGEKKVEHIIENHRALFEQFRKTGRRIKITAIPGNHDHELACYPRNAEVLRQYNINLESKVAITREIADRKIWIEHGNQNEDFNTISDFGNPYCTPLGYYVVSEVVSRAGKTAERGKSKWVQHIESVYPNEYIPVWMASNYYYREMNAYLRWFLAPFLMLFGLSFVALVEMLLAELGVISKPWVAHVIRSVFGHVGKVINLVISVNVLLLVSLLLLLIPLLLIKRDFNKALKRYGLKEDNLSDEKDKRYVAAAKQVFAEDPVVAVYVYGHTHEASLRRIGDRAIVNTGSWLLDLRRVKPWFRFMPDIFVPAFDLGYFRIFSENDSIVIQHRRLDKDYRSDLTLLQRCLTLGRRAQQQVDIPDEMIIRDSS